MNFPSSIPDSVSPVSESRIPYPLTSAQPILDAVARGAALLDDFLGPWYNRIDLNRLDMRRVSYYPNKDGCGCVLAQLDADQNNGIKGIYGNVLQQLFGSYDQTEGLESAVDDSYLFDIFGSEHGFDAATSWYDALNPEYTESSALVMQRYMDVLDAAWRQVILARRGEPSEETIDYDTMLLG